MINKYFEVEGNIMYLSNNQTITWGPIYYNSEEFAISKVNSLLIEIAKYAQLISNNENLEPYLITGSIEFHVLFFRIDVLNDNNEMETCHGIITYDEIEFEDQEPTE